MSWRGYWRQHLPAGFAAHCSTRASVVSVQRATSHAVVRAADTWITTKAPSSARGRWALRRSGLRMAGALGLLLVAAVLLGTMPQTHVGQRQVSTGQHVNGATISEAPFNRSADAPHTEVIPTSTSVLPQLGAGSISVVPQPATTGSAPLGPAARDTGMATPSGTPTPTVDWGPQLPLPTNPITLAVGPFNVSIDLVHWVLQAILGFFQWIVEAIVGGIMALIGPFFDPSSPYFLLSTPHLLTDQNVGVLGFIQHGTGWAALAALALIIVIGGYNIMVRLHLGLPYHTVMEFVPRLALGAVGTVAIVAVIGGLIDLVNGLDHIGTAQIQIAFQWPDLVNNPTVFGLIFLLFALCYTLLLLMLSVQLLVRLALIDVCLVMAPIALVCWILPQTQRWTQFWLNALLGALFVQPLQVLTLALGTTLMATFSSQANVWGMLFQIAVGIAAIWLAWRMPRLIDSWAVRFSIGSVGSPLDFFQFGGFGGGGGGNTDTAATSGGGSGGGGDLGGDAVGGAGDTGAGGAADNVVEGEVVSSTIIAGDIAEAAPVLLLA